MRISAWNFKGISEIVDFDISGLNVFAGANSGGKSSLIQLLLLIKQSLEAKSLISPLKLNRPYTSMGRFENLPRKSKNVDGFRVKFSLTTGEVGLRLRRLLDNKQSIPAHALSAPVADIVVDFGAEQDEIVVRKFSVKFHGELNAFFSLSRNEHQSYTVESDRLSTLFRNISSGDELLDAVTITGVDVSFFSFFPEYFEWADTECDSLVLTQLRINLQRIFNRITYIGPLRQEPREFYFQEDDLVDNIGNKGENAAFILSRHGHEKYRYKRIVKGEQGTISFITHQGTFQDEVDYWISEVFGLARGVIVSKSDANRSIHTVHLEMDDGALVPINHVGFGISQILPIVIEALRPSSSPALAASRHILILEQPEIHLHPVLQAQLFDFVNSCTPQTSFIIETHSDHFVNRLRRRVAEDLKERLIKKVKILFVERDSRGIVYRLLNMSEIGTFDFWPKGFFDQYDLDVKALVRAQARKRLSKKYE